MSVFSAWRQTIGRGVAIDTPDGVFQVGTDPSTGMYRVAITNDKEAANYVGKRDVGATAGQRATSALPQWAVIGIIVLIVALALGGLSKGLRRPMA